LNKLLYELNLLGPCGVIYRSQVCLVTKIWRHSDLQGATTFIEDIWSNNS